MDSDIECSDLNTVRILTSGILYRLFVQLASTLFQYLHGVVNRLMKILAFLRLFHGVTDSNNRDSSQTIKKQNEKIQSRRQVVPGSDTSR